MARRYLTLTTAATLENIVTVNVNIAPLPANRTRARDLRLLRHAIRRFFKHKAAGLVLQKVTNMAMPAHIDPVGAFLPQSTATVGTVLSTLGHAQTMATPQPDRLSAVRYQTPNRLQVTFADGRSFSLPIRRLQMPVSQIDWPSAAASPDGTAMTVREIGGREIPIDAGAVRCMVDKGFAAQVKAALDAIRLTREERRALSEVSDRPAEWDSGLSRDADV
jgi:hypothetical protein